MKLTRWVAVLCYGYIIGLLAWFGVWVFAIDAFWWMTVLNYVGLDLFWPAPLVLVWGLWGRRRWRVLPALLPVALLGYICWPYYLPHLTQGQPGGDLRVMTYNVLYSNSRFQAVAEVVKRYQPDLLALQEVQPQMMQELVQALHEQYPYFKMGTAQPYGTTAA